MSRLHLPRYSLSLSTFNSLRAQLLLWIALPVTVSLLAISIAGIRGHEQAMTQLVQQQAKLVAHSLGVLTDSHIEQRQELLLRLAAEYLTGNGEMMKPNPAFAGGLTVIDPASSTFEPKPAWVTSDAAVALVDKVRTEQVSGLATIYDEASQAWLLVQAVSVPTSEQRASAVLVGAEPVAELITRRLIATLDSTLIDEVQLTTANGTLLYAQIGNATAGDELSIDPTRQEYSLTQWVTGQTTILSTGWQVTVSKDWRKLVPPILTFGSVAPVIVGIAIALSLLSAYFGLRNIVWPLQRLDHATAQIGLGNFTAIQQPVGGVTEVEELRLALARMTEQIRQYQQELQSYIGAITLGQEEERRRLARELHDATVQDLIALNQRVEMVGRELTRDPQRAATRLQELRPQVTTIIDGLRRQIHALRPLYLEDLGFIPALEMLLHENGQHHQVATNFTVTGNENVQPTLPIQISAFRIAQEALQNVVKHSRATRIDISVHLDESYLTLRIADDGCGFAVPGRLTHLAQEGHFGLLGMKERVQLHSGVLEIESQTDQGTVVNVRLPLYDLPTTPPLSALSSM